MTDRRTKADLIAEIERLNGLLARHEAHHGRMRGPDEATPPPPPGRATPPVTVGHRFAE